VWSTDASAILLQWRTQLLACPTVTTLGIPQDNLHYPNFDITKEPLPAAVAVASRAKPAGLVAVAAGAGVRGGVYSSPPDKGDLGGLLLLKTISKKNPPTLR
jgi:hypothetical protein